MNAAWMNHYLPKDHKRMLKVQNGSCSLLEVQLTVVLSSLINCVSGLCDISESGAEGLCGNMDSVPHLEKDI